MSSANNGSTFKQPGGHDHDGLDGQVDAAAEGTERNTGTKRVDRPRAERSQTAIACYRVRDWSKVFERGDGRKIQGPLNWVGVPARHDGGGYRRLINRSNGAALFGCWIALIQVVAKCNAPRGALLGRDGPLTPEDLEAKTGLKAEDFAQLFEVASEPRIGWLERVDLADLLPATDNTPPDISGRLRRRPDVSGSTRTNPDGTSLDKRKIE